MQGESDQSVMAADEPRRIYPDGESFLAALDDLGPDGDCTPEEAVEAVEAVRAEAALGDACESRADGTIWADSRFLVPLLRKLAREGHSSGILLSRGRRKQYRDVIRSLEKQEARNA